MSDTGSDIQTTSNLIAVPATTSGGIPVVTITTTGSIFEKEKPKHLPTLPSYRYRYTLWHDLKNNDITGDQLRNPRVRKGPPVKDKVFYEVKDEQGHTIHHSKKGIQRKQLQEHMENWEQALKVNLSYQNLAHDYQVENLHSILKRLYAAEEIQLIDNELQDLAAFTFPRCLSLNLTNNFIANFKKLPKCQTLKHLNLCDNSIDSFSDINSLRKYPDLQSLDLRRNPICFEPMYRQRVFEALPSLLILDHIQKLPSDDTEDSNVKGGCVIS